MQIKHTRRNILSLLRNHMIKDEFALYIEMLALDTMKLKWIWTKLCKKELILLTKCLIQLTKDEVVFNKPTIQIFETK